MSQSGVYGSSGGGGGTPITQINGNTGYVKGATVTITTGTSNGTSVFTGNDATVMTQTFDDGNFNLFLGTSTYQYGANGASSNVGLGITAGESLSDGAVGNVLLGATAGQLVSTGIENICIGYQSGIVTTGIGNISIGASSGGGSEGNYNTCVGSSAGPGAPAIDNTSNYLVCIGYEAGNNYVNSESNNIVISNPGTANENNVLRIGAGTGTGQQELANAYISGINGVNVGSVASVVSISGDHLGSTTITAGTGITVTPGANTITIASSSSSFTWQVITTSQSASVNNGYITNSSSLITVTLPSTAAVGSLIELTGRGTGGWKIGQNSGQSINFGVSTTTTGTGGSLSSSEQYDSVRIVCIVANTTFNVLSSIGNLTVV